MAATGRQLEQLGNGSEFRSDLYYRLNVFPIQLPPLRERRQGIVPLIRHYVDIFSRGMAKQIVYIPEETLNAFGPYSWPVKIRERQTLIEPSSRFPADG